MYSGRLTCSFWRPSLDELISMINSPFRQRLANRTGPTLSSEIAARIAATLCQHMKQTLFHDVLHTKTLFTGIYTNAKIQLLWHKCNDDDMMMAIIRINKCN